MKNRLRIRYLWWLLLIVIFGCTNYSVTMIHSEGESADVIKDAETLTPTTTVNPSLTIPTSALP
jgi:hypothetical protein